MIYKLRLCLYLPAMLGLFFGTLLSAQTQELLPLMKGPSISGSFLAGQEAFKDLRTDDASRYFLDASEAEWENAAIVERTFIALAADGRIDDAAALAQHLIELEPDNEMARLVLGTIALKERRYEAAVTQLEPIESGSFIAITATIVQAWALVGDGKYTQSQELLDELGRTGLEEFLTFHRAIMADVAGEYDVAIEYASVAYESDPFVARIVEAYARMLGNALRFEDAQEVLHDYEAEGLSHPIIDLVAEAVAKDSRPGKLASTAQIGSAEMFHGIGAALTRDGTPDVAIVFLRLGLYLDPSADVITMALGQLLDGSGRYELANAIYDSLAQNSPMKAAATVRIAENLDAAGDREEAIRRLGNIVSTQPDNLDAVSVLGDLYRYDGQYGKAIDAYTKALEIVGGDHPRDWRFYYVRGIANERADRWPGAEADFLKALDLNPGHPQVLNYLGYSWVDQGMNLQQALEMIRQAVDANPTDGYVVDSLGWAYYRLGRIDEAVQTLEQAVQLRSDDPEINDHLGDAYWKAGRKLEARFQWTVAVDVDADGNVTERASLKLASGLDENSDE